MKDITLLTVNFNQKYMTAFMLQSFMKLTSNTFDYLIIDNSTNHNESLINSSLNVFENIRNRKTGDFGQCSKNHCSTIDYALKNLIKTKYVLLCDNDIFFKSSIVSLLEERTKYDCIGEIGWDDAPPNRIFPYLNIIDVEKFNSQHLNYFDKTRIIEDPPIGKYAGPRGIGTKCWYHDTGSSFYEDIKDSWNIKNIKLDDYIVHNKTHGQPKMRIKDFILKYKDKNL